MRDRILGIPADLHAADAMYMYHRKCNAFFHRSIHRANNPDDKYEVVCDDTDVYELLLYFY